MKVTNDFLWKINYYAYHITNTTAMKDICLEGLKPSVGERSRLAGDDIKGIFFFNNLCFLNNWIDQLYQDRNVYELELLRFNLKNRNWIKRNPDECYFLSSVNERDIEYLRIYNKKSGVYLPLNLLYPTYNKEISWNHLKDYKPLIRRKEL